jgi:hypothetical protein
MGFVDHLGPCLLKVDNLLIITPPIFSETSLKSSLSIKISYKVAMFHFLSDLSFFVFFYVFCACKSFFNYLDKET